MPIYYPNNGGGGGPVSGDISIDSLVASKHSAIGNVAQVDQSITYPSWPIKSALTVAEEYDDNAGDTRSRALVVDLAISALTAEPQDDCTAADFRLLIKSDSTEAFTYPVVGAYSEVSNDGSGDVTYLAAHTFKCYHNSEGYVDTADSVYISSENCIAGHVEYMRAISIGNANWDGGGTVTHLTGLYINEPENYGSVTNNYGIVINDQSGIGTNKSINIESRGTGSLNVFEGHVRAGTLSTKAVVKTVTDTTYSVSEADTGSILQTTNSSGVTINLPKDAGVGTYIKVCQLSTGQVSFVADLGATLNSLAGADKITGQYGVAEAYVSSNSGSDAVWVLSGDITS